MNKREVKTIEDLEQYYNKARKIKFASDIEPKDITEIFNAVYNTRNSEATYFKTGTLHCEGQRTRSLDDYINLCKSYFPETTIVEAIKVIEDNKDLGDNQVCLAFCPTIRKDNFRVINKRYVGANIEMKTRNFKKQGFPNCNIKIEDLLIKE